MCSQVSLRKHHYEQSQWKWWNSSWAISKSKRCVKVLHSICQQIWKTQQWPQDWKMSVSFQSQRKAIPKNAQTTAQLHSSHISKVMLKILQARLQQYMNWELPDVQAGFRKGRGTRDQIANICWIIKKVKEFQKNIYFFYIDYAKAFDFVDHSKLWKMLKEMGIPDYLSCLLRNLHAGQEATVRTGHGRAEWFQMRKGVCQGCILSPGLFNLYTECIMRNAGLDEAQAGIKTAGQISITSDMQMTQPLWQKAKKN